METEDLDNLPRLCMSPAEKFMDEFEGNSRDLRGFFKIPQENKDKLVNVNSGSQPNICWKPLLTVLP